MGFEAYCLNKTFEAGPRKQLRFDRHYLLYALSGSMRLQANGRRWTLPPARAALIAANEPIDVTVLSRLTTASVLFARGFISTPPEALSVFEMSPLARELIAACRGWDADSELDDYARRLFLTLGDVVLRLAATPSPSCLPAPSSHALQLAIELTEAGAAGKPDFGSIACAVGLSPRTLARRFSEEMGMTWREMLRRIRIVRAIEFLATTDKGVTEIAFEVGYTSISAFNSAFRELTGKSPRDFRATFGH